MASLTASGMTVASSYADLLEPGDEQRFPVQVLSDSESALVLFAAAFYGAQDAALVASRGLTGTCVDRDGRRLEAMRALYPDGWEFVEADVFEFADLAAFRGQKWDVVTLDPFTNMMDDCARLIAVWCSIARDAVILGTVKDTGVVAPSGWQVVDRVWRSNRYGGVFWTVLEPTGTGITPDRVSACLVTRGDQPEQLARIIETLPYDEVIVWDNSEREDFKTSGRYMAALEAKHDVVYFQDDDVLFTHHAELMAAYEPGRITSVYAHGYNDGGYGDLPLVGAGALADRDVVLAALDTLGDTDEDYAYADFHVGILTPFRHVHLPFEINLPIAQHPSRLCNQPWAADAKRRVTERARAIRDARA